MPTLLEFQLFFEEVFLLGFSLSFQFIFSLIYCLNFQCPPRRQLYQAIKLPKVYTFFDNLNLSFLDLKEF